MNVQAEHLDEEVRRLQRCLNDLVSVMALPALWRGGDPPQIGRRLIDVLQRILDLDLVYLRLNALRGETAVDMSKAAQTMSTSELSAQLNGLLGEDHHKWPSRIVGNIGDKDLSLSSMQLGLHGNIGVLVAGADRPSFPEQTEQLLIQVAVNQAVLAMHEARRRIEQERISEELDQRVAQRTIELAAANQQLQLQVGVLQLIPVTAWTLQPDGTPDFVNQKWLEYTGQTFDYVVSRPEAWMIAVHPDDRETASRVFWEGIRSGQDFAMETRFRRARDGAYRWHLNRGVALRDANGTIVKFVGTSTDIQDLKRSQETLRNTQAELANMTRVMTMGQLTASIAHEVNQPLSGIITNASTCLRMLDADPPNISGARETARRTIRDGERASNVITRLRALFSRREAITEPVDLSEAAQEVLTLVLAKLHRAGVVVKSELDNELPLVAGDRVQLQQVIMNLLQNASDAMLGVHDRSRELLIQTRPDGANHVRLTIQDRGVGLDQIDIKRLFDAFYTSKRGGMGVGLAVSRSIIESHHGRLWAEPNDGPGASFAFTIPRCSEADAIHPCSEQIEGNANRHSEGTGDL